MYHVQHSDPPANTTLATRTLALPPPACGLTKASNQMPDVFQLAIQTEPLQQVPEETPKPHESPWPPSPQRHPTSRQLPLADTS